MVQGRRRVLKSGTAIERHRCSPSAEGTSGGEHERGSKGLTPSPKGGLGDLPRENFQIQDVCRSDSEVIFAKLGLLYRHYMTLYSNLFRTQHQSMNSYFDPSIGLFFKGLNCSNYLL